MVARLTLGVSVVSMASSRESRLSLATLRSSLDSRKSRSMLLASADCWSVLNVCHYCLIVLVPDALSLVDHVAMSWQS